MLRRSILLRSTPKRLAYLMRRFDLNNETASPTLEKEELVKKLKIAYFKKAKQYHPDTVKQTDKKTQKNYSEIFIALQKQYEEANALLKDGYRPDFDGTVGSHDEEREYKEYSRREGDGSNHGAENQYYHSQSYSADGPTGGSYYWGRDDPGQMREFDENTKLKGRLIVGAFVLFVLYIVKKATESLYILMDDLDEQRYALQRQRAAEAAGNNPVGYGPPVAQGQPPYNPGYPGYAYPQQQWQYGYGDHGSRGAKGPVHIDTTVNSAYGVPVATGAVSNQDVGTSLSILNQKEGGESPIKRESSSIVSEGCPGGPGNSSSSSSEPRQTPRGPAPHSEENMYHPMQRPIIPPPPSRYPPPGGQYPPLGYYAQASSGQPDPPDPPPGSLSPAQEFYRPPPASFSGPKTGFKPHKHSGGSYDDHYNTPTTNGESATAASPPSIFDPPSMKSPVGNSSASACFDAGAPPYTKILGNIKYSVSAWWQGDDEQEERRVYVNQRHYEQSQQAMYHQQWQKYYQDQAEYNKVNLTGREKGGTPTDKPLNEGEKS